MKKFLVISVSALSFSSCMLNSSGNDEMISLISDVKKKQFNAKNEFNPDARLIFYDSVLYSNTTVDGISKAGFYKAIELLKLGREDEAIALLEEMLQKMRSSNAADMGNSWPVMRELAMAYLRLGEKNNCINNHGAASCIFPIKADGIHTDKTGSAKAAALYALLLESNPNDLESRWLLNIAYMTMGTYPQNVPVKHLIPGLDKDNTPGLILPFTDMALRTGLNTKNMAGGSIVDDFNNDGYLDIITSSWDLNEGMHYCINNHNGSFTNVSEQSGLQKFTGGLNIMQTDYNNDGLKDIFVLRGAWKGSFGKEPNSLLRNNGDGTFTDVTKQAGLLSFYPTQTATWNDFNNDGWLDVFIGNEAAEGIGSMDVFCELYINNKNGTFTNVATETHTNISAFVKGVTSGDYDNDGWVDIFISTMQDRKYLLKNMGVKNGTLAFTDVTKQAGLGNCRERTFPTWFWDYNNDGLLDILVCNYNFSSSLAWYAAAEALNLPTNGANKQFLFKNKGDGTFEDVTDKAGLNKIAFAMGSNFGDVDNDGYPDIYLGTGNPQYQSLVPNKMFKNLGGEKFADVTTAAKVGNLQKGHGVSFCDLDNDGDEDIYTDMGGAYAGDAYENSLYINPGQNKNGWINLKLQGTQTNTAAIGAKIKVTFKENNIVRSVYRDVNSGGSFGSNPLVQHIGIGSAKTIESVEVKWPVSHKTQVFKNLQPGDYVIIKEGATAYTKQQLNVYDFSINGKLTIGCSPLLSTKK